MHNIINNKRIRFETGRFFYLVVKFFIPFISLFLSKMIEIKKVIRYH